MSTPAAVNVPYCTKCGQPTPPDDLALDFGWSTAFENWLGVCRKCRPVETGAPLAQQETPAAYLLAHPTAEEEQPGAPPIAAPAPLQTDPGSPWDGPDMNGIWEE